VVIFNIARNQIFFFRWDIRPKYQKTVKELTPLFDQHLRLTEIPILEIQIKERSSGNIFQYRWKANAEGFTMPISYQIASGEKKWLYPNSDWQKQELGDSQLQDLDFHTDRFYFNVEKN
jgi:hypothetical protein